MIFIACSKCGVGLRVSGDITEVDQLIGPRSDYWPDKYSCFSCGAPATGFLLPEVSEAVLLKMNVVDVSPQEAFAALNGLGIPAERTCCEEVIVPLFSRHNVKVKGRQLRGQSRYFIDELEFSDGTRLCIGTSPQGAVAYRVIKPHSYVRAVEEAPRD